MFIQTEPTPNPATLKFIPGVGVMPAGTADFRSAAEAVHSPLAQRLFGIDGVVGVFLGSDFVSITKAPADDWSALKPVLLGAIMEHFVSGAAVVEAGAAASAAVSDNPIVNQICELIETRVRPAVAQDGGDIVFRGYEDGVVLLQMQGSCSGCPSSTATLKHGIENMLKHFIPEVVAVRAV
jgi:Fe-S cluster biogenesis protein NfuA